MAQLCLSNSPSAFWLPGGEPGEPWEYCFYMFSFFTLPARVRMSRKPVHFWKCNVTKGRNLYSQMNILTCLGFWLMVLVATLCA